MSVAESASLLRLTAKCKLGTIGSGFCTRSISPSSRSSSNSGYVRHAQANRYFWHRLVLFLLGSITAKAECLCVLNYIARWIQILCLSWFSSSRTVDDHSHRSGRKFIVSQPRKAVPRKIET